MSDFKLLLMNKNAVPLKWNGSGYNMHASEDVLLEPNVPLCVPTGIKMSFPNTHCGLITKVGIKTLGGLIDSDYRGEVKVIMVSKEERKIKKGEVVAQINIIKVATPDVEVEQGYPSDSKTDIK